MHYMKLGVKAVQGFSNRNLVEQLHNWKTTTPTFSLKKKKKKKKERNKESSPLLRLNQMSRLKKIPL